MKKFLNLGIIVLALVSAFQFGVPFYHYLVFKSDLKEVSKLPSAGFKEGEMLVKVKDMARDMKVPLKEEDITLTRGLSYRIELSWEETVNWLGFYQKTFQFTVDTSATD
jgi:hypothetical protein